MAKKNYSIEFFKMRFSRKVKDENQRLQDLFKNELENKGNYSASYTYKFGDLEFKSGYYVGTLIGSKYLNLPLLSNSITKTADELPIGNDQSLGFATNFIFDTYSQIIAIERIANGVTTEKFGSYLKTCHNIEENFKFDHIHDPQILKNYKNIRTIKYIKIKIARVVNGNIFESNEKNVKQLINASEDTNTDILEIKLSSEGIGNSLKRNKINQIVDQLKAFNKNGKNEVKSVVLYGKDEDDEYMKPFDMVSEIMKRSITVESTRHINALAIKIRKKELEDLYLRERPELLLPYDLREKK